MIKAKISGGAMRGRIDPYARMNRHITNPILDHADGSVTKEKLADEVLQLMESAQPVTLSQVDSTAPQLETGVYKITESIESPQYNNQLLLVAHNLTSSYQVRIGTDTIYFRKSTNSYDEETQVITISWSGWSDLSNYYAKEETDNLLALKADKARTLSGYDISDAYTNKEVDKLMYDKQNVSDDSLETTDKTIVGAINEINESRKYVVPLSQYGIDKIYFQESLDKKSEETILHEVTVNAPTWPFQPKTESSLDSFAAETVYYVTLLDTDGNSLPDGQFKLMDFVGEYATAYEPVFTLSDLVTGTKPLTENRPVEFTEDYRMRDAGVSMVTFDINKSMDSALHFKVTTIGEFVKTDTADYFVSDFRTNQGVSTYYSSAATTWNSDSEKYIRHFISQGNDASKIRKFRDDFSISKKEDQYFATERKHLSRVLPYGTTSYKNYSGQSIGFGQAEAGIMLLQACVYSVRMTGYIRNGSVIRVTEVK